jgi:hypothetical protein
MTPANTAVATRTSDRWVANETSWAKNVSPRAGTPVSVRNWPAIMIIATPAR